MKNFLLLLAGVAAAAACILVSRSSSARAPRSIDDLAHELQGAWADHHTVA